MDRKALNKKWFEVIEDYSRRKLCDVEVSKNQVRNQIRNLALDIRYFVGAVLPFENIPYFRYCSLPETIGPNSPLRRPMAIVEHESVVCDAQVPAAKGIHAAIMSQTPVGWALFQDVGTSNNLLRAIDYEVAKLERTLFAPTGTGQGLYIVPIVYGTFPFIILLLSPKQNLVETYGEEHLRSNLEILSKTAIQSFKQDFEAEIIKLFVLQYRCADKTNLERAIKKAFFNSDSKFSSWTIGIPGHYLNELPSQQGEKKQVLTLINDYFKTAHIGGPTEVAEIFEGLQGDSRVVKYFEEPHDPWLIDDRGFETKKKVLRDGLFKLLLEASAHLADILNKFQSSSNLHEGIKCYSQIKSYLWTPKHSNGDWGIPFGLICDWPLIVSGSMVTWDWKIDCNMEVCPNCKQSPCTSGDDIQHVVCHFSSDRFGLKISPYKWVEALRALVVGKMGERVKRVNLNLTLGGQPTKPLKRLEIRVTGGNLISDVDVFLGKEKGDYADLRTLLEKGMNTKALKMEDLPAHGNKFGVSIDELRITLK